MIAPAAAFLLVFLAYPLGLGFWLGMTDATIGQRRPLRRPRQFRLARRTTRYSGSRCFNTIFYTVVASVLKFGSASISRCCSIGDMPIKSLHPRHRAVAVRRADGALGDRLLVDLRSAVLDHLLVADQARLIDHVHRFSRRPWNARWSVIAANVWRGIPFVAITLLAGLQTISPSLYEAATLDGASALAALPLRHPAAADRRSSPS